MGAGPAAPHPADEKLKTVLLRATPAARERLRAALEALKSRTAADTPLVTWSPKTGTGTATDPLILSYPSYDKTIEELLAALPAVNAQPVFDWMSWNGSRRYPRGAGLVEAPVADAMRLITAIVRGERFCDGTIARAVEDGSLVAAAERINATLDQPALPK